MIRRILLTLSMATALALPIQAQFVFTLQQNGQGSAVANGGVIVMNAPSLSQNSVTATVTVTYTGTGTANFPSSGQIFGATGFTVAGGDTATSLSPFQSTSFTFNYSPPGTAQTTAEFLWPFNETSTVPPALVRSRRRLVQVPSHLIWWGRRRILFVGPEVSASGFQTIPTGGTFSFLEHAPEYHLHHNDRYQQYGKRSGHRQFDCRHRRGLHLDRRTLLPLALSCGKPTECPGAVPANSLRQREWFFADCIRQRNVLRDARGNGHYLVSELQHHSGRHNIADNPRSGSCDGQHHFGHPGVGHHSVSECGFNPLCIEYGCPQWRRLFNHRRAVSPRCGGTPTK